MAGRVPCASDGVEPPRARNTALAPRPMALVLGVGATGARGIGGPHWLRELSLRGLPLNEAMMRSIGQLHGLEVRGAPACPARRATGAQGWSGAWGS